MMRGFLIGATISIFVANNAYAQTETRTGSRVPEPVDTTPIAADAATEIRRRFVACVYERRPERVDALLVASDMLNANYRAAGIERRRLSSALGMDSCLGRATSVTDSDLYLTMDFPSLRAMLVEHSYRASNPSAPAWLQAPLATPVRQFVSEGEELNRTRAAAQFADCLVAAAPREADALVRTAAGSVAERSALRVLRPHLGPCVLEGMQVSFTPAQVRALVADGLWVAWRTSVGAVDARGNHGRN